MQLSLKSLSRWISPEVRKQRSRLKGEFTAYISKCLRNHALDYYNKNRDKITYISLEDLIEEVMDEREAKRMSNREFLIAYKQELARLTPLERKIALYLLVKSFKEIALAMGCSVNNVYETRDRIADKLESLKED